jgi:hypothetical protein
VHSDDLYSLGTWADMDSQGVLVTALMVGSIVEGVAILEQMSMSLR